MLQEKYEQFSLQPQYITSTIDPELTNVEFDTLNDKEEKVNVIGDDDMVEVLVVSDEYAMKVGSEESGEEYEIVEVEQSEYNGTAEPDDTDMRTIEVFDESDEVIPETSVIEDEPKKVRVKKEKLPAAGVRRSKRGNARKEISNDVEAKVTNVRHLRKSTTQTDDSKSVQKRKNDVKSEENRESTKVLRINSVEHCEEEADEGESGDEFPARDSDNDDWPAQQTISEFPKEILRDGLLQIKGKQLMSMICK